jgi:hypothetical protein
MIEVLKHINGIVVSLDRLDSAHADMPFDLWKEAVVDYFMKSEALKALPECRTILSAPFPTELGEDDMDELEREMQGSEYWSFRSFMEKGGKT